MADGEVVLVGATGFTGRLTARALVARGLRPVLVGRSAEKLERLAGELGGLATRVVDLARQLGLAEAFTDARVVVATAGPFSQIGEPVLALAARMGLRYLDSTGEQPFVHLCRTRYEATALAKRACIVPSFAFESALGDFAAHLAARDVAPGGDEVDAIDVVYRPGGFGTTRGTRLSAVGALAGDTLQHVEGDLVREPLGRVWLDVPWPGGRRSRAASFAGVEPLNVPRHVRARTVRSFMVVSRRTARIARFAFPLLAGPARRAISWLAPLVGRSDAEPSEANRTASRFAILAEARLGAARRRVIIEGTDPYGLTAELLAGGAARMLAPDFARHGFLAPSEAFDPEETLARLSRFGVSVRRDTP